MRKILASILALCIVAFPAHAAKKQHTRHKHGKKLKSGQKWDLDVDRGQKQEEFYRALAWGIDKEKLDPIFQNPLLNFDPTVTGFGIVSTKKPCTYFEPCFGLLSEESLDRGVGYSRAYCEYFDRAESIYRVPPAAILGIFRVETNFGNRTGYRLLPNTFLSIYAFSLELDKRSWAVRQMTHVIKSIAMHQDVFSFFGSSSGAFGLCQFLPASYRYYGVDGDGDGVVDLMNPADAIMSTARYLRENGWGESRASHEAAVYAYNHSDAYVKAVLTYARAIDKKLDHKITEKLTKELVKKPTKKLVKKKKLTKKFPRH